MNSHQRNFRKEKSLLKEIKITIVSKFLKSSVVGTVPRMQAVSKSCVSFLTFKGWSGPTSLTRLSDFGEGSSVERQNYAERTNKRPLGTHPTHTINLIDTTDALRNFAHHSRDLIKLVYVRRLDVPG